MYPFPKGAKQPPAAAVTADLILRENDEILFTSPGKASDQSRRLIVPEEVLQTMAKANHP